MIAAELSFGVIFFTLRDGLKVVSTSPSKVKKRLNCNFSRRVKPVKYNRRPENVAVAVQKIYEYKSLCEYKLRGLAASRVQ